MKKLLSLTAVAALITVLTLTSCNKRKVRVIEIEGIRIEEFQEIETEDGSFLKDGYYKAWHDNGQIHRSGHYVKNKEDGHWITYFRDGKIHSEGDYQNGNKEGHWVTYTEKGELESDGDYVNGKMDGNWKLRMLSGKTKEYQYKNGILSVILGKWIDKRGSTWIFNEDGTYKKTDKDGIIKDGTFKYESERRLMLDSDFDPYSVQFSEDKNEFTASTWVLFDTYNYIDEAKRVVE